VERRTENEKQRPRARTGASTDPPLRLLPWEEDGKPCYLSSDGDGIISRVADDIEAVQLDMAREVVKAALPILHNPLSPHGELRYAGLRLSECLVDAIRVADSRGGRIPEILEGQPGEDGQVNSSSSGREQFSVIGWSR